MIFLRCSRICNKPARTNPHPPLCSTATNAGRVLRHNSMDNHVEWTMLSHPFNGCWVNITHSPQHNNLITQSRLFYLYFSSLTFQIPWQIFHGLVYKNPINSYLPYTSMLINCVSLIISGVIWGRPFCFHPSSYAERNAKAHSCHFLEY